MANKIGLTIADVTSGNYVPHTGLNSSDFNFVLASDGITTVSFSGFAEIGNGNYVFYGFDVPLFDGTSNTIPYKEVQVKIGGTAQPAFGTMTVFHDSDEPVSKSYTDGRVDREGDTVFGWLTQDTAHWRGSTALTAPADYNLIHKKYVADNFATLSATNSLFPLNTNRIVVDSQAPTNITGKVYQTIAGAVSWIHSTFGTLTGSNRWEIFVIPHPSAVYTEDFYWYDYIDIIGLGWVKIRNTALHSLFIRSSVAFSDYNCRAINLQFEQTDVNLEPKFMLLQNCSFNMIGDSYNPTLTLSSSQFIDCNFSGIGTGGSDYFIVTGKGNKIMGCTGSFNISWDGSDSVFRYDYVAGIYITQ